MVGQVCAALQPSDTKGRARGRGRAAVLVSGDGSTTRLDFAPMLRLEPKSVDVAIHRARSTVGAAVPGLGGSLFETRVRTRQIRLGPEVCGIARL